MAELRVTSTGTIKLFESDDTSSVTIASPASLGGDRTITLPDANVDLTEVNTMPIANLDIDGGTDIGANIADSDLLIIDDGAGGTNRKTAASRLKTYVGAGAGAFDIANLDIDGGTDIGADIADSDLFIIDDGAGGTNRKTAASRLKTYIGSGGLQFIQSQIVSSDTTVVNFDDVFSATYDNYLFLFDATLVNAAQMEMRYRTGSPTNDNYTGSNTYRYAFSGQSSTNNNVSQNSNANNKWTMGDTVYAATNIGAPAVHGFIHFNTPFTASTQRTWTGTFVTYDDADEQRAFSGGGRVVNGTQMTGFGFSCSSGDFSKFTGRVYGVVDS